MLALFDRPVPMQRPQYSLFHSEKSATKTFTASLDKNGKIGALFPKSGLIHHNLAAFLCPTSGMG